MRIGIFQCNGGGLALDARLRAAVASARTGGEHGLDLVLCPELFASGYNVPAELAIPGSGSGCVLPVDKANIER